MELQASIDITMVQSSGLKLENNIKTVYYVLKYARTVYNDFIQRGIWDKCINATPGKSGLLSTNPGTGTVSVNYKCFNCNAVGDHTVKDCPKPADKEQIKLKREEFNAARGRVQRQSTKFNNNGKPIPHKWRVPEDSEQNKRVIDNKPYTYNPTIKGWVVDDTLPANFPTVGANLATTQTEIEQLKAENERLQTDQTPLPSPEKSINFAKGPHQLGLIVPQPTKESIIAEMTRLKELFSTL